MMRVGWVLVALMLAFLADEGGCQFGNIFEQFFQQDDSDHHPHSPQAGPEQLVLLRDQSRCAQYLCPSTFDCVPGPADCPCPFVEDIKCPFSPPPPASASHASPQKLSPSYVCTRAPGCPNVQRALSFGS